MSGGFLDLTPWKTDPRISALMWSGYPGMMGGQAIAEAIFGVVAPSGRLPYSIRECCRDSIGSFVARNSSDGCCVLRYSH